MKLEPERNELRDFVFDVSRLASFPSVPEDLAPVLRSRRRHETESWLFSRQLSFEKVASPV